MYLNAITEMIEVDFSAVLLIKKSFYRFNIITVDTSKSLSN